LATAIIDIPDVEGLLHNAGAALHRSLRPIRTVVVRTLTGPEPAVGVVEGDNPCLQLVEYAQSAAVEHHIAQGRVVAAVCCDRSVAHNLAACLDHTEEQDSVPEI